MAGNPKCHRYKEIRAEDQANCINCHNWRMTRCKYHDTLSDEPENHREIENLMRHDGYERGRGGIRQIRRGS